ncbi:MAG TPA: Holliday junction branch migration protein RuvA [Alphaproteobacteria bacterium]|nr:Holliday junction branch migration protein RuvA [Alphaproteobacteria bacterium]
MIAKLRGILDSTGEDWAVLDVGGVGYLVYCSARTLARLPEPGGPVTLEIETHVREDHIHLYGFLGAGERAWFRLLTTVQGVGARLAVAIQGVLGPEELARAVAMGERASLTRAPGVGPKLAQRILTELKDKVDAIAVAPVPVRLAAMNGDHASDAVSALVNLGYRRPEAVGAVSAAVRSLGAEAAVESLIKAGLKELAR